jgi:hypothetical protein
MVWLHASREPVTALRDLDCRQQAPGFKPAGLWLGAGVAWLQWMRTEMPQWARVNKYTYKCYLKREINVFRIDTFSALKRFSAKYGGKTESITYIDWSQVCRDYDGLIVTNYKAVATKTEGMVEYLWFRTYDIDCACIWRPTAVISSIQRA